MLTVAPILIGLHAYIGWRLLPALPISMTGAVAGGLLLGLSALLIPLGMLARFFVPQPAVADRISWAGLLVMGLFSSVLVLTLMRDLFLLTAETTPSLAGTTATAVLLGAALLTAIGFIDARRVAQVSASTFRWRICSRLWLVSKSFRLATSMSDRRSRATTLPPSSIASIAWKPTLSLLPAISSMAVFYGFRLIQRLWQGLERGMASLSLPATTSITRVL